MEFHVFIILKIVFQTGSNNVVWQSRMKSGLMYVKILTFDFEIWKCIWATAWKLQCRRKTSGTLDISNS